MTDSVRRFAEQTRDARRVLVVDLGFLGDAVHLLPALWSIRQHYRTAELHILASGSACEVIGLTQVADRLWPLELRPERRKLTEQWKVMRQVRQLRCDAAINLNAADRSIFLTALSGARHRLALLGGRRHFWNRWLIAHWLSQPDRTLPVYEQLQQALAGGGFTLNPPRFNLEAPESARAWAREQLPSGGLHLSLCSANALKEWPVEHYARLIALLRERHAKLTIAVSASGRVREQQRVDALLEKVGAATVVRLPSTMTVAELVAVLARCSLHVGPDSGVIHLATALGLPTVSFFRRRGEGWRGWVPRGENHEVFLQDCACLRDSLAPCAAKGIPKCLQALEPPVVARACERLFSPRDHD